MESSTVGETRPQQGFASRLRRVRLGSNRPRIGELVGADAHRGGFREGPSLVGDRDRRAALLIAAVVTVWLASVSSADAFVYWANVGGTTIGRANLDGSSPNQSFITGASGPCGVAVNSAHIYWANSTTGTIGRANLDGTSPDQSFIPGANIPCGVAVDAAHVYWANSNSTTIGRANLDGSSPNQSFITGATFPLSVAVDSAHVYWDACAGGGTTIGRADLDGVTNKNQSFVTGADNPCGVAVDASHVYWANYTASLNSIGRAGISGGPGDQSFITGANNPCGVAVDAAHVYWANQTNSGTIGRANLDGTSPDQSFIPGASLPCGVAADSLSPPVSLPPSNAFTIGKVKGKKLTLALASAGAVQLTDAAARASVGATAAKAKRSLKPSSASGGPGKITVLLRLTKAASKKLRLVGNLKVRAAITFTPNGGVPNTQTAKLRLTSKKR